MNSPWELLDWLWFQLLKKFEIGAGTPCVRKVADSVVKSVQNSLWSGLVVLALVESNDWGDCNTHLMHNCSNTWVALSLVIPIFGIFYGFKVSNPSFETLEVAARVSEGVEKGWCYLLLIVRLVLLLLLLVVWCVVHFW